MTPVRGQDVPGSNIVSRTLLSSDGTRAVEQRVYDNGLGDVVQEIQSYPGSTLPSIVIHHEYDEYRRRTRNWLPVTSSGSFTFRYYNKDHLGNNREVVNGSGTVQQVTNYYPSGAPYAEPLPRIRGRFPDSNVKKGDMPSVVLTKEEHKAFTNAWRKAIPYDKSNAILTTSSAKEEDVINAAKDIYRNYPEIFKALGL